MESFRIPSRRLSTVWRDRTDLRWIISPHASVGYLGWLNRGNLGDESMYVAHQVLSPVEIRRIPLQKFGLKLAKRASLDTLVLGGGTLLGRGEWGNRLEAAIDTFRPNRVVTFGVGVEEPEFAIERNIISAAEWERQSELLKTFTSIGVRGPRSQKILANFGIKSEVLGDPALILKAGQVRQRPLQRPKVILSLAAVKDGFETGGREMREEVARAARQISVNMGAELIGLPMERNDIHALRSADREISILGYPLSVSNLVNEIESADLVISERLHPNIIAAAVGTRFLAIGYKPKTYDFAESIGASEFVVDSRGLSGREISEKAEKLLSSDKNPLVEKVLDLSQKFSARLGMEMG